MVRKGAVRERKDGYDQKMWRHWKARLKIKESLDTVVTLLAYRKVNTSSNIVDVVLHLSQACGSDEQGQLLYDCVYCYDML